MANKYDLELALDSYRAQNGKESEVGLMDSWDGIQYGSQRFSNREQAMWWLKQQKPNHDAIQKMIAEERKNYPNSGLGPLMETYEKYYKQVQIVQFQTEKELGKQKPVPKVAEEKIIPKVEGEPDDLPNKPPVFIQDIPAQTIPGPTRRVDGFPESPRYPIAPTPVLPVKPPETIEPKEELSTSDALKQLNSVMDIFRSTIKDVSKKSGTFFDTPEEIEKYKASINDALKKVLPILKTLESRKLSKTDKAAYDKTVLEIAKYFDNTLDGVKNRHYRNYDLAFDLALSLIKDDLKKQNITIPPRPSQKDILGSLKSLDPKLQKKIEVDMRAGYDLGQILSNPQVRSQWESVYEKVYGKYEDEMQTLLKSLKDKRPTMASTEWQKALDTMISIMGTKDAWDIKSRNRDLAGQTVGMVASTVGGVWAFLVTIPTGGTSAILGSVLLSGAVTTAGMILTKWRAGNDLETWTELGINTATFWLGWAIAKWANFIAKSGITLARTAGISLDATGGLALGISADHVRAWEADTSITLSDSFKNNWYWALLPIALGAKWSLRNKADAVKDKMDHAAQQAHNGDTAWAKATVAHAEKSAAELAPEIKAQQSQSHKWARVEADAYASTGKTKSQADFVVDSKGNTILNKANEAKTGTEKKATPENVNDVTANSKKSTVSEGIASKHIDPTIAKNAIHKAEKATIDDVVGVSEKQNFIAKYGAEKWAALSQSFKDAPKWVWNGAKSIFGVVTGIGRSTVSWKWATIWMSITEVIEAYFNLNGTERDWNPMNEDGIKNIWGMLWQILAYRYMGIVRWFIVTEWYRVIPTVYTQVRDANK